MCATIKSETGKPRTFIVESNAGELNRRNKICIRKIHTNKVPPIEVVQPSHVDDNVLNDVQEDCTQQ